MNRILYCLAFFAVLGLSSCQFHSQQTVDLTDIEAAKGLKFQVISQHETDLSSGLPTDCYLPDGTPVNEYAAQEEAQSLPNEEGGLTPRRANSVTTTAIIQELVKYGNQSTAIEIVGTYPSVTPDFEKVTLSGKVLLPKGIRPKRLIIVSHYTVCSNAEAPSNCFSLEGILVKDGYGLIIPDYLGYGVTADRLHPYLVMLPTAYNVTDMYFAVREWLKAVDLAPEHEDIYLMGYSQGGATAMAVEYLIEKLYSNPGDSLYIPVRRVFAGGGPYDVQATYERFVNTDTAGYPVAVPLVVQGMIKGTNLPVDMSCIMQKRLCDNIDEWINSKRYTSSQLNTMIGTTVTHELLTPEAMDQKSDNVAELYKAMKENSITSYNWEPHAPVYMLHSMDDQTVPYTNAVNAKDKWHNANITYNFGHYGSHVKTCLRFISTVRQLLYEEERERSLYE